MEEKKNIMDYDTVTLDDENSAVVIIDQTKLPAKTEIIALKTAQEIWDAIYLLQVRGARHRRGGRLTASMCWQRELIQRILILLCGCLRSQEGLSGLLPSYGGESVLGFEPHGAGGFEQQRKVCC